jgi:hypothetical protein
MEKLVYVAWKPDAQPVAEFSRRLRGETAAELLAHGVHGLTAIVADAHAVAGLRIAQRDPTAVIALWVDSALQRAPLERVLAATTSRLAGYLALESVPLVNRRHPVAIGERIPGLYTVAFLEKPERLDYDTWLARWQGEHTTTAIETQRTFQYVQNVLVRPLTPDAPPWTAIVEEAFPAAAATDPLQFYAADSGEQLAAQQRRMMASCERFIDFARFETLPMSAYVLKKLNG